MTKAEAEKSQKAAEAAAATTTPSDITVGSYVTVIEGYASMGDASNGPLTVGKYGIVLEDDKSTMPFKVHEPKSGQTFWYKAQVLKAVSKEIVREDFSVI